MRYYKVLASLAAAAAASSGLAYADDEMTSLSYISYLERYATVQPGDGQETVDAVANMPIITGDRLDTARGARVEVQLADGGTIWIDEFTTLDFDALAFSRENPAQRTVLFLQEGTVAIELPGSGLGDETLRFDFPGGTVFLNRPGLYRLDLRSDQLHVEAHAGLAELPEGVGSTLLRTGHEAWLGGGLGVRTAALSAVLDDFWDWVQERRRPAPTARTAEVVGGAAAGRAVALDSYGTWVYLDSYSTWAWRPYVQFDWAPYRHGRWHWTPVGWTWLSYEPWGWYPYHYGSWTWNVSHGWLWCWDWVWGPAWVHWIYTPGYIGWCPRGYYDWWYYGNGHGGGHWQGDGHWQGGPGGRTPSRWTEAAYDLSGRVRLREVDPRPWNMVPANQFHNSRLDRVRVDPGRILREASEDARGYVRSGPLVTPPSRNAVEGSFDTGLRGGTGRDAVPALGTLLRREGAAGRATGEIAGLRPVRTGDLVAVAPRGEASPGTRAPARGSVNERVFAPSDRPMIDVSPAPRSPSSARGGGRSPATGGAPATGGTAAPATGRSGGSSQGATPPRSAPAREPSTAPPARSEPAGRSSPSAPKPREIQPAAPSGGSREPTEASPPSQRKPGYAARVRSYDSRLSSTGPAPTAETRGGGVTERTYVVPFSGGQRVVRVTSPSRQAAGASSIPAGSVRHVTRDASTPRSGWSSVSRPPSAVVSPPRTSSPYAVAPRSGAAPAQSAPRSPSPSYTAPRSAPAPAYSAPRASAPSSSGGSRSSAGASGGSRPSGGSSSGSRSSGSHGSGGSRPSGRR